MKKINKSEVMKNAWKMFRQGMATFSECLKKSWQNAKILAEELKEFAEEVHTWYGWKMLGFMVKHGSTTVKQVVINGRILSFFTKSQVAELVARLARPRPGDRICDPTVGSGGLL